jgi:4-carboxymuconolactone decarboxylase
MPDDRPMLQRGDALRREVLGDEHVERSRVQAPAFRRPMQELTTEYCWGTVWGREGLDRRSRSILNLGMLAALNREPELRLHLRAALTNGLTPVEIQEILLQVAIYCGVPAGMEAFKVAEEVLREEGVDLEDF